MQTQEIIDGPLAAIRRADSLAQVAAITGVHRSTIHRLVQAGKLKAISGFGNMKVSDEELSRFLGDTRDYQSRANS